MLQVYRLLSLEYSPILMFYSVNATMSTLSFSLGNKKWSEYLLVQQPLSKQNQRTESARRIALRSRFSAYQCYLNNYSNLTRSTLRRCSRYCPYYAPSSASKTRLPHRRLFAEPQACRQPSQNSLQSIQSVSKSNIGLIDDFETLDWLIHPVGLD